MTRSPFTHAQKVNAAAALGFVRNPATGDYHHKDGRQGPMTVSSKAAYIAFPNWRIGRQRFFGGCMVPLLGDCPPVGRTPRPGGAR